MINKTDFYIDGKWGRPATRHSAGGHRPFNRGRNLRPSRLVAKLTPMQRSLPPNAPSRLGLRPRLLTRLRAGEENPRNLQKPHG